MYPKEYWQLVNQLREKKQKESHFDTEKFTLFFEKLYSTTDDKNEKIKEHVRKALDKLSDMANEPEFLMEELIKAIKALKNNKATGPDRIPAEMLKASSEDALKILLKTMNKIKTTIHCPEKWAVGITSLLFKEGDDEDPNNYRAITVADSLSKILAILINERLDKWCSQNNILKMEQIGFQKKSRPGDHLMYVICTKNNNRQLQ